MLYPYNLGFITALNDVGIVKVANPQLAAEIASGADPQELQTIADAKITEKDIESCAKVVQVMAEMKQKADEAGLVASGTQRQGGASQGQQQQAANLPPQMMPQQSPTGLFPQAYPGMGAQLQ